MFFSHSNNNFYLAFIPNVQQSEIIDNLFYIFYLCVMGYKFIKLTSAEELTLEEGSKKHPKSYFRKRCACILLSNRAYDIKSLAILYKTRINTIGTWFANWNEKGIVGLQFVQGQGRKAVLSTALVQEISEKISINPQDLAGVCCQINQKWGLPLSTNQLK
jgi:transposase